jgi:hypothetical protein
MGSLSDCAAVATHHSHPFDHPFKARTDMVWQHDTWNLFDGA